MPFTPSRIAGVDYLKLSHIFFKCHKLVSESLMISETNTENLRYWEAFGFIFARARHSLMCAAMYGEIKLFDETQYSVLHLNSIIDVINQIVLDPVTAVPVMTEILEKEKRRMEGFIKMYGSRVLYYDDQSQKAAEESHLLSGYIDTLSELLQG